MIFFELFKICYELVNIHHKLIICGYGWLIGVGNFCKL